MTNRIDRRLFVTGSTLSALHIFVMGCSAKSKSSDTAAVTKTSVDADKAPIGLGDYVAHDGPVSPVGDFKYIVIQKGGDRMSDGHIMGAQPDGMVGVTRSPADPSPFRLQIHFESAPK